MIDREAVVGDLELDELDAGRVAGGDLFLVDRARRIGDVAVADAEEVVEAGTGAFVADDIAPVGVEHLEVLGDRRLIGATVDEPWMSTLPVISPAGSVVAGSVVVGSVASGVAAGGVPAGSLAGGVPVAVGGVPVGVDVDGDGVAAAPHAASVKLATRAMPTILFVPLTGSVSSLCASAAWWSSGALRSIAIDTIACCDERGVAGLLSER